MTALLWLWWVAGLSDTTVRDQRKGSDWTWGNSSVLCEQEFFAINFPERFQDPYSCKAWQENAPSPCSELSNNPALGTRLDKSSSHFMLAGPHSQLLQKWQKTLQREKQTKKLQQIAKVVLKPPKVCYLNTLSGPACLFLGNRSTWQFAAQSLMQVVQIRKWDEKTKYALHDLTVTRCQWTQTLMIMKGKAFSMNNIRIDWTRRLKKKTAAACTQSKG